METTSGRPERESATWWRRLWARYWTLPALIALGSLVLGAAFPLVDERLAGVIPYVFESGPDGARQLLGTLASAMISVTGLVFSITMVVLQLASSQFTPRLLGQFLQSRVVQLTLGVFIGSFVYSLTVLRLVRGGSSGGESFVPQGSVTVAFVYVLTSVALFIAFIHHITQSVRVSHVIADIGRRTRQAAERLYAGERTSATWSPSPDATRREVRVGDRQGYVTAIDATGLTRWAAERDGVVTLDLSLGQFVAGGERIGTFWGGADEAEEAADFVDLGRERDLRHEHAYGIRQLTDIADRALSPGINDPTTAVQVVDEVYAVLRPLVAHPDPSPYLTGPDDRVRATYRPTTVAGLVEGSLVEIAHYAKDSPRVRARVHEALSALLDHADPRHQPALRELLATVDKGGAAADRT